MEYKATLPALASALVLTMAAACGWAVVTYIGAESYDDYVKHQRPQPYHPSETVAVTPEGEPLIAINMRGPGDVEQLINVDRSAIKQDPMPIVVQDAILPVRSDAGFGQRHGNRFLPLEYQTDLRREPDVRSENWYFVLDDARTGRGWLEGYDRGTRERIGFIGRNGLSSAPPPKSDQFAPAPREMLRGAYHRCVLQWRDFFRLYGDHNTTAVHFDGKYPLARRQCLILDEAGVHLVDLGARTASVLFPGPVESMAATSQLEPLPAGFVIDDPQDQYKDDRRYLLKIRLAVRAQGTVQLVDLVRNERRTLSLPSEFWSRRVNLSLLGDGNAVLKTFPDEPPRAVGNGVDALKVRLTWCSPDGRVTRQEEVENWRNAPVFSAEGGMLLSTLAMPMPLVGAALVGLNAIDPDATDTGFAQRVGDVLRATWPGLLLAVAGGALACWLVDRHRRRHRLGRDVCWLAFAFLFGLPAYAGYVWHRRWPPVQLAAPPERTGIEIIAA